MSCVHYKFFSKLNYDTVTFDGLYISLCDLKKQIMGREKLRVSSCDLQISNAETKEEYTDDNALIYKNSSVMVRRIPVEGVISTSKTYVLRQTKPVSGTSKANLSNSLRRQFDMPPNIQLEAKMETKMKIDDSSVSTSLAQLIKTANLAEANASEEDKIKAMMVQSAHEYDPINYMKKPLGPPPPSYTCFRCGKSGHYIKNCPTNGDKNFKPVPRIKKSTGIPRSFMMEVKDPNMKGAMLTNTGKYVIPIINAEAYAIGKKEKLPFLPEEPSSSSEENDPIPDELLCLICKDIVTDAVVIPCCGNSYCDECIRTALLESDEHTCPTCHQNDVSPDALIANKFLRQAVNNFKNETGYTKRLQNKMRPPPPPRPLIQRNPQPVMQLLVSRQQDPLMIPVKSPSIHAATSISLSMTPNQSSLSSTVPINQPSTPAPVPDITSKEKPDGLFCDPDNKIIPAAALVSDHPKTSSITIHTLMEEKTYQIPFQTEEPSSLSEENDPIPDELLCLICKDIVTDAVVIPCCGNSYCDECIRTALLESDEQTCPTCHQNDVSPDALIANKFLLQAVNNFKNETGYTKRLQNKMRPPPPPIPPPRPLIQRNLQPVMRLPISRQQDPLMIPVKSASIHAATSISSSMTPNQSSSAVPINQLSTPAPVPDITATEKPDGPFCDPDNKIIPAAVLVSDHPKTSSSITIHALMEEKTYQIPVLGAPSLLGQSLLHGQLIPTIDPVRTNAAHSAASGRHGWKPSINRRQHLGEHSQRTQGPSLPATPVPPPPLYPPPQFPPHFPPGQPPPAGYNVPPPGFPPAPTNLSTAVQTAHSNTIPTTQALPLSREEFYREQRRLKEEEKKKSKLYDFTNDFAKEMMEYKKIQKKHGCSFSRSKSPSRGSSYSRSSHIYSKSRSGSSCSCCYSRSFSCSHSPSYSRLPSRRGRGKSQNYRARSRSHGYHCSRSRSPPYRGYHSRSRSPPVFRGQSPNKRNIPQGATGHHTCNKGGNYPEKLSARDGHTMKDSAKSKEKENENPPGDGKGNKHKKHQKRRKEEENEEFPNTELLESSRKKRKY